jgi:HAD superfamily 5'-nucleotidase-like hydrolase
MLRPSPSPSQTVALRRDRVSSLLRRLGHLPVHERTRQVFCNRDLEMKHVRWVGFDMDYTLAIYRRHALDELAHRLTLERLIEHHGLRPDAMGIPFDPEFAIRGLCVDKHTGHILKMNSHRHVGKAWHGLQQLETAALERYRRQVLRLVPERFMRIDTLFELPEAYLICALIEHYESRSVEVDYQQLAAQVRQSIDLAHADNSLKGAVVSDFERYIIRDPELPDTLHRLRSSGKRLFLLTNSDFNYSNAVMTWLLGGANPRYPDWTAYFDLVITAARKPHFFRGATAFQRLARDGSPVGEPCADLEWGGLYAGGNVSGIERLLARETDDILYVGDHIYGDILRTKRDSGWRTAMVVPELELEVRQLSEAAPLLSAWDRADQELHAAHDAIAFEADALDRLQNAIAEGDALIDAALRSEIEGAAQELSRSLDRRRRERRDQISRVLEIERDADASFHPRWGSLFFEGNERSLFGEQVDGYADLYTSRVTNFLSYSPVHYYRAPRVALPHEFVVDRASPPST